MTPDQASAFLTDYGPVIWTVFFIIAGLGILIKAWPTISKIVEVVDALADLPDKLDKIDNRLENVEHEVRTNGGSSIKDAVKRIEDHLYSLK